ncbi:MAG: hypothetical protein JG767_1447 [Deferribacteraceae bacterium]|nr:hypothetical protein [Deferribacteraceae bacterium]
MGKRTTNSIRTCVICKNKFLKYELLRFVRKKDEVLVDIDFSTDGRGFYICYDDIFGVKEKLLKKMTKFDRNKLFSILNEGCKNKILKKLSSLRSETKEKYIKLFCEDRSRFLDCARELKEQHGIKNIDIILERLDKLNS